MALSAKDDKGNPVDWWFMYKVAGKSKTAAGKKVTGTEYVYFDSNMSDEDKLVLSSSRVDGSGALPNTLNQLYDTDAAASPGLGWFFYNDENPLNDEVNSVRGHTKGVLAFDLKSNSAFWLIQSTPKFPEKGSYSFPKTGMPNAQTLLCITLQDADTAKSIAGQMSKVQQPNVYLASAIPASLAENQEDARVQLMNDKVADPAQTAVIPFYSKGGVKFMSIAKSRIWQDDFYNNLVGSTLHENLDVETWEHDPAPQAEDHDKTHTVVAMKGVNLNPLGIDISWSETDDHAKLAISAKSENNHYVCVGDINFTIAQEKRGGGTVAFQCEALWKSISEILEEVSLPPKGPTGA